MDANTLWLYALASLLLLAGHAMRAVRWGLLLPGHQMDGRFNLLLGLSLGYVVNAVVPWRLGELARLWFVAQREEIRPSFVASSVVAERLTDLLVIGLLAGLILMPAGHHDWRLPTLLLVISATVLTLSIATPRSTTCRTWIWRAASVFNDRIRFAVIDFFWSLSEMVTSGQLMRPRYLSSTVLMWCMYFASYALFARASGEGLSDLVFAMLGGPLSPASEQWLQGKSAAATALLAFTVFPVLGVLTYGAARQLPAFLKVLKARRRYGWSARGGLPSSTHNRFKAAREYEFFLVSLFNGNNQVTTSFGLEAIDDGTVHKLFHGGSDAITALVEVKDELVIRKFAVGAAGTKLRGQHDWLKQHRSEDMPLVELVRERIKPDCYHYDMPLIVPASDFYDFIHTNPIDRSQTVISEVMGTMTQFHARHAGHIASDEVIGRYLREKASDNAQRILDFAQTVLSDTSYTINGRTFDLTQWQVLLDPEWLMAQVRTRTTTVVHGDLTVENIIVTPQRTPGWYIIDPNPENVFNTELIDWAKLMQSVHLGYEGLNRNFDCVTDGHGVQLAFTKSHAYTRLHEHVESLARARFGEAGLREIYFHELINYLRLTPYKIRQSHAKGVCFFACTSILLDRYLTAH